MIYNDMIVNNNQPRYNIAEAIDMFDNLINKNVQIVAKEFKIFESFNILESANILMEAEEKKQNIFVKMWNALKKAIIWLRDRIVGFVKKLFIKTKLDKKAADITAKKAIQNASNASDEEIDKVTEIGLNKIAENNKNKAEDLQDKNEVNEEKKFSYVKFTGKIGELIDISHKWSFDKDMTKKFDDAINQVKNINAEDFDINKEYNFDKSNLKDKLYKYDVFMDTDCYLKFEFLPMPANQRLDDRYVSDTKKHLEEIIQCQEDARKGLERLATVDLAGLLNAAEKDEQYYEERIKAKDDPNNTDPLDKDFYTKKYKASQFKVQAYKWLLDQASDYARYYNTIISNADSLRELYMHNLAVINSCYEKVRK